MSRRLKQTTTTLLVEEALRAADDFLTITMLVERTSRSRNQVSAALFHLRTRRVVDVIVTPDGGGWWYARPSVDDTRGYVVVETAMGVTKRPHKRRRKAPPSYT